MNDPASDVVIIGLGPAGALSARVLADAGLRVTVLQPQPPTGLRVDIVSPAPTVRETPSATAVLASAPQLGRDGRGGSKLLAAPQSYRLDPGTFRLATLAREAGLGDIPGVALHDWPLDPHELLPYYERVERRLEVAPRPETSWTARMSAAATRFGHHPFPAPAAAAHDTSPLVIAHDRVRILDATALAILRDSTGAVSGVEVLQHGERRRIACGAVVLAGSVIPSVRLLLLSDITAGGLVGSAFMSHNSFVVNGLFPDDLGRDTAGQATAVAISSAESETLAGRGTLGGSILQAAMTGPRSAGWVDGTSAGLPEQPAAARAWVTRHAERVGGVWAQPDQLPRTANRIDLDPTHTDPLGRAVPRLTLALAEDDLRRAALLREQMTAWLEAAGASRTWSAPLAPQPLGSHLYGGLRMGTDVATSVVDSYGRAHTVPGLVIAGSSTFPTTGGRGPVETIEALAWRSAERLAADLGAAPATITGR